MRSNKKTTTHSLSLPPRGRFGGGFVVIADDITGAAEMAGIAHRFGYQTKVQMGGFRPVDTGVLVIDSNTRSMPPNEAAETIRQIMKGLKSVEYQFIYKKTDSALRGHIAVEIDGVIENSSYAQVVFAPANPSLGRTIEHGIYFVNGKPLHETDFANDPEFPAKSSKVSEVVQFKNQAIIPDLVALESFSEIVKLMNTDTMAAGGGDFFTAILNALVKPQFRLESEFEMPEKSITMLGSLSQYSQQFLTSQMNNGAEFIPVPTFLISGDTNSGNLQLKWIESAKSALKKRKNILLKLDGIVSGSISPKEIAGRFSGLLMSLITELGFPLHILIEGGSTAASFFSAAGITSFDVVKEHQRGIVSLKCSEKPELLFTIKPGSYVWPEQLVQRIIYN